VCAELVEQNGTEHYVAILGDPCRLGCESPSVGYPCR
jgi:hypothetical protein